MHKKLSILVLIVLLSTRGETSEIFCEHEKNFEVLTIDAPKVCFMNQSTVITSPTTFIALQENRNTNLLTFNGNRKIHFLPENIQGSFPNLKEIDANECSIKEISRQNFKHLKQLMKLKLRGNELVKIPKNCFEDLVALEVLDLRKNILKCFKEKFEFFILNRKQQHQIHERPDLPQPIEAQ